MSKKFEYFKATEEILRPVDYGNGVEYEWDGDDGYYFEYEVSDEQLKRAVTILVDDYYFEGKLNHKNFENFIRDFDVLDELVESFEDELQKYFEDDAFESLDK